MPLESWISRLSKHVKLVLALAFLCLPLAFLFFAFLRTSAAVGDESIYASVLVRRAPPSPLEGSTQSFVFSDARGSYTSLRSFPPPTQGAAAPYVNVAFTRAGFLRSGDLHRCEQLNHLLFGSLELTLVIHEVEVVSRHKGGDVIRIAANVPHLYKFTEDTLMTETWRTVDGQPCAFEAWLYGPLRDRIPPGSAEKNFTVLQS